MKIQFDTTARFMEECLTETQKNHITSAMDNIKVKNLFMYVQKNENSALADKFYMSSCFANNRTKTYEFNFVDKNDIYERIIRTLAGIKQKMEQGTLFDGQGIKQPPSLSDACQILGLKIDKIA